MTQYVYRFGGGVSDGGQGRQEPARRQGREPRRDGRRSACRCRRASPSRPTMCARLLRRGRRLPARACAPRSPPALAHIESVTGKKFGDAADPLLVSVRSGARVSMPGMMDTVLNLGLNDATVEGLAADVGRRALRLGQLSPLHPDVFRRRARTRSRRVRGSAGDRQGRQRLLPRHRADRRRPGRRWSPSTRRWSRSSGASRSRRTCTTSSGARSARCSARGSRSAPRSIAASTTSPATGAPRSTSRRWCSAIWATPRRPASPSPAIPSKGDRAYYGEFLINAQGEDVVAGIRTPQYLTKAAREAAGAKPPSMEEAMPEAYAELAARVRPARDALPRHAGHRVHGRAGQALDAPDALGQAHRQGRAQDRGRHGRTKA